MLALLESAVEVEQLEHGRVEDRVHLDAGVLQHALLDFLGLAHVFVFNAGFEQGPLGELVDFHLALHHVDVEDFHALFDVALVALGLYQYAECDLVGFDLFGDHEVLDLEGLEHVALHNAHVHDAVLEHAVDCDLVGLQFVQPTEDSQLGLAGRYLAGLLLHALDHGRLGLLVGSQPTRAHLLEQLLGEVVLVQVD